MELALKYISIGYGSCTLVSGLDATFTAGSLTAVTGRNGTGKSTLLRVMAGLAKPLEGRILIDNVDISTLPPRKLAATIGFVSTERIRITNLKVRDLVALGRAPYTDWIGRLTPDDRSSVAAAIELVGMTAFADKQMDTLSDGEAGRVMIARVLAQDTPVILLDEPTAFLDFCARREICELLAELAHDRGKTVIFSSHELDLVREFADRRFEIDAADAHCR